MTQKEAEFMSKHSDKFNLLCKYASMNNPIKKKGRWTMRGRLGGKNQNSYLEAKTPEELLNLLSQLY